MPNMSYCRFENTSDDLYDVLSAIEDNELDDLSDTEIEGLKKILAYSKEIISYEDRIEEAIEEHNGED